MQVVTPVRRSARKPARDTLPVSTLLEKTEYAYMPNEALAPRLDLDTAFQQLSLASKSGPHPDKTGSQAKV